MQLIDLARFALASVIALAGVAGALMLVVMGRAGHAAIALALGAAAAGLAHETWRSARWSGSVNPQQNGGDPA